MPSASAIAAIMKKHGEAMTLGRIGVASVTVYAKEYDLQPSDLTGDIQQGDRAFRFSDAEIAAAAWPGPPRKFDSITTAAGLVYAVQSVDTRRDGAAVLMHICRAKGDA